MIHRLVAIALFLTATFSTAADKPNILFIAVDDLRPEIASYGSEQMVTPHFDRLAKRGVRFDRAFCMVPTCGASRASLMTGIRPSRQRFKSYLSEAAKDTPGITTLNTHFKNHGYTTISLGKIFHMPTDNADGWSEKPWRPKAPKYITDQANANIVKDKKGRPRGPSWENGGDVPDDTYADGKLVDHAITKLQALSAQEAPFFLAVGFMKPHLPFVAPGKYYEKYPSSEVTMPDNYYPPKGAPEGAVHSSGELRAYSDIPKKGVLSEEKARELIRGYRATTCYTDAHLGRLLDTFDNLGLAKNTVIVLWGDHGWNLGEHTMWCKHSCFETSVRAPLIFSTPESHGYSSGTPTESIAEFIDIYPTLCELAGLPKPKHLEGTSLVPVLKEPTASVKEEAVSRFGPGDTIRTKDFRYSVYRDKKGKITGHMLYDHRKDPGENTNVTDDPAYTEIVADLSKRLEDKMGR